MESGKRSLFGAQVGYTPVRQFSSSPFVGRIHLSAMSVDPSSGFDRLFSELLQSWLIQEQTLNFWDPYVSSCLFESTMPATAKVACWRLVGRLGRELRHRRQPIRARMWSKNNLHLQCIKKHRFHTFGKQSSRNLHTLCSIWLCWPIDNAQGLKDTAAWHSEN